MEEKIEELSTEILLVPSFTEKNKNIQGNECFFLIYWFYFMQKDNFIGFSTLIA